MPRRVPLLAASWRETNLFHERGLGWRLIGGKTSSREGAKARREESRSPEKRLEALVLASLGNFASWRETSLFHERGLGGRLRRSRGRKRGENRARFPGCLFKGSIIRSRVLATMRFSELVRLLERNEFRLLREKGSLRYYRKAGHGRVIRIDFHGAKYLAA